MGCNCGRKRLMNQETSVNIASSAPDRPDIAAAKAAAQARVEAVRSTVSDSGTNGETQ